MTRLRSVFHSFRWLPLPAILLCGTSRTVAAPDPAWRETVASPLTLKLRDLNSSWYRFVLLRREVAANKDEIERMKLIRLQLKAAGVGLYFSQGRTVELGGQQFLLAYRVDRRYIRWDANNKTAPLDGKTMPASTAGRFAPGAQLNRCLIQMDKVGDLEDWRPYNPALDVLSANDEVRLSRINQTNLGGILLSFVLEGTDEDGIPLRSQQQFQFSVAKNNGGGHWLSNPATLAPYRVNTRLGGLPGDLVINADKLLAVYESVPRADGTYAAIFLNGNIQHLTKAQLSAGLAVKPVVTNEKQLGEISTGYLKRLREIVLRVAKKRDGKAREEWFGLSSGEISGFEFDNDLTRQTYSWRHKPIPAAAQQQYNINPALKGQVLDQVPHPESTVMIVEANPDSKRTCAVIYLDGHTGRLTADEVFDIILGEAGKKALTTEPLSTP